MKRKVETLEIKASAFYELQQDASRYRWLKLNSYIERAYDDEFYRLPPIMKEPADQSFSHETFDKAIDLAMSNG